MLKFKYSVSTKSTPRLSGEKLATCSQPNSNETDNSNDQNGSTVNITSSSSLSGGQRLIALGDIILEDEYCDKNPDDLNYKKLLEEEGSAVYRREVMPTNAVPLLETSSFLDEMLAHFDYVLNRDRHFEKLKENQDAQTRHVQSQVTALPDADGPDTTTLRIGSDKEKHPNGQTTHPSMATRKVLDLLPVQQIQKELQIIEVQQRQLQKAGDVLRETIRNLCEAGDKSGKSTAMGVKVRNTKEVDNMILQLFELVNEKNKLFRKQAELVSLRRQYRLEQEHADLESEIRLLMSKPEISKGESDKVREKTLLARLVEVVMLRNEVVDCLEMDRLREAQEDSSIKQYLDVYFSKRGSKLDKLKNDDAKQSKKDDNKNERDAKKPDKSQRI